MKSWKKWLVAGIAAAAIFAVGGPFLYINVISGKAPARLDAADAGDTGEGSPAAAPASYDGTWNVTDGSQVGYRVKEVLFGQNNEAVGRTGDVTGSIVVDGTTIESGTFTADMTTIESDQQRRDNQFRGRIMDVAMHPTATFALTEPVDVGSVPAEGQQKTYTAKGKLTLRGTTKEVSMRMTGLLSGGRIRISGSIPIVFAQWSIPSPSFGPVTTEDNGELEFALNLKHA